MNIALWAAAGLLALVFLAAGALKLSQPKEKLAASGMGWAADFSAGMVRFVGAVEILGAVGLILPPLVNIAAVLAPLAATGLGITMIGAIIVHLQRKEYNGLVAPLVLLAVAAFVAVGRFVLVPFGA